MYDIHIHIDDLPQIQIMTNDPVLSYPLIYVIICSTFACVFSYEYIFMCNVFNYMQIQKHNSILGFFAECKNSIKISSFPHNNYNFSNYCYYRL